jgi:hypothetical protein
MGLQSLLHRLRPRKYRVFPLLLQQAELIEESARLLATVTDRTRAPQAALDALSQRDQRGAELLRTVLGELAGAYLAPFDREDLHGLSTMLHGVLGSLCWAGQALIAYESRSLSPATQRLIQICIEASQVLHVAVQACSQRHPERLAAQRLHLKALERSAEAACQAERVALFKSPQISAKQALRQQALLDALRAAIGKCQLAGNVLERLLVKHA